MEGAHGKVSKYVQITFHLFCFQNPSAQATLKIIMFSTILYISKIFSLKKNWKNDSLKAGLGIIFALYRIFSILVWEEWRCTNIS
jgi:hypothetical protein